MQISPLSTCCFSSDMKRFMIYIYFSKKRSVDKQSRSDYE